MGGSGAGGRCYVYREWFESDLVVSQAARRMLDLTAPGESIVCTMAPAGSVEPGEGIG